MKIHSLHNWAVTYREAVAIQQSLKEKLILHETSFRGTIRTVAGADISYDRKGDLFFAAVIILSYPELSIIEEKQAVARAPFPYIPGLLSFREAPVLLQAFALLENPPDVALFDGQGIAHPRGVGLASHMGLFLDLPTIGCAKKRLVGGHDAVGEARCDRAPLVFENQTVGMVLRSKNRVKPLFVSQGHNIGLERAVAVVLACCRGYRLPEPIRQAHLAVNRMRLSARRAPRLCL
ncbi:MAG: deoxyribonuclease V [Deltaproteobacteria bacterium]|nr:deoxyribonuclease V [Deltaproteobacteria bacterium]